ncbi:C2 domain-containing protein [Rutstroemia sp. NJR-2017a BBW]|nr:C2 domain-containing protein [Rutstroemia sp. NJR-2017a BBW]PQE08572.1 C2 domain-containing protein [Rutstroemia sp. NJR-2017a BBW]
MSEKVGEPVTNGMTANGMDENKNPNTAATANGANGANDATPTTNGANAGYDAKAETAPTASGVNGTAPTTNGAAPETHAEKEKHKDEEEQHDEKQHRHDLKAAKDKLNAQQQKIHDKNNPPGGYDATPIPHAPNGFTVRITFHRAENLPVADLNSQSSDPFLTATLTSSLLKRHKEDPDLVLRTQTIHKNTDPVWNKSWTVAGIPSSGFRLKCRLYDEDAADHDDRLGNVTIYVDQVGPNWQGFREKSFDIGKRMGSKRAYGIRACTAMFNKDIHMDGRLIVSAEYLGPSDEPHGRMYTVGETCFFKHYSPMIGRLAGTKAPGSSEGGKPPVEKYDFQANQIQLEGPVPAELYHRYVEFKPFVKGMFSKAGLRGRVLNKALHHQHARVYNFSNTTEYGTFPPKSEEASLQFLKMAHFDEGGRIFTYVLTLDGVLRFTETGKEFGVDLLSKHTMHSDVNIYIACSGEFFIRRLKHPNEHTDAPNQATHPGEDISGGPPHDPPPKDPKHYELVIDNDSGTYRPKGDLLPHLKRFLNENFPGLHVVTKECTDDHLQKMKQGQREKKKKEGKTVQMIQDSDDEISSSDEEDLDRLGGTKKSKRERMLAAVEDPSQALKDSIPGHKGKQERVERETEGDRIETA